MIIYEFLRHFKKNRNTFKKKVYTKKMIRVSTLRKLMLLAMVVCTFGSSSNALVPRFNSSEQQQGYKQNQTSIQYKESGTTSEKQLQNQSKEQEQIIGAFGSGASYSNDSTIDSHLFSQPDEEPDLQMRENGQAMLEELVRRFLEKNSEVLSHSEEQTSLGLHNELGMQLAERSARATVINASNPEPMLEELIDISSLRGGGRAGVGVGAGAGAITTTTTTSTVAANMGTEDLAGYGSGEDIDQFSAQELDDRHIQYDMVRPQTVKLTSGSTTANDEHVLDRLLSPDEDKLLVVLEPNAVQQHEASLASSNNTLDLVQMRTDSYVKSQEDLNKLRHENDTYTDVQLAVTAGKDNGSGLVTDRATTLDSTSLTRISLPATNGSSQLASGNIQARSLAHRSGQNPAKMPQHSRAPYATHDQFQHRADVANAPINARSPLKQKTGQDLSNPEKIASAIDVGPALGMESTVTNSTNNNNITNVDIVANTNTNTNTNTNINTNNSNNNSNSFPRASQKTNTSTIQGSPAIMNSINRIESHLDNDVAGASTANVKQESEKSSETRSRPDEKQLQKLASVNQLVDLNPMPASEQMMLPAFTAVKSQSDSLKQTSLQDSENNSSNNFNSRFQLSKDNQVYSLFPSESRGPNWGLNDRYANVDHNSNALPSSIFGSKIATNLVPGVAADERFSAAKATHVTLTNHDTSNGFVATKQQSAKSAHDSKNNAPNSRYKIEPFSSGALGLTTMESMSNQLHHLGMFNTQDLLAEEELQAQENLDQNLSQQRKNHSHHRAGLAPVSVGQQGYAASLINVTAPMVFPLSATEAMEIALGEQLLQNQVRSLSISKLATSQQESLNNADVQPVSSAQPQSKNQYFIPQNLVNAESQIRSIYSQPANQFSPKLFQAIDSNIMTATTTKTVTSDGYIGSNLNDTDKEKERIRLDGNEYIVSTRRPLTYINGHNVSLRNQASGFRLPSQASVSQSQQPPAAPSIWPGSHTSLPSNYLGGSGSDSILASLQLQPETPFLASSSPAPSTTYAADKQLSSVIPATQAPGHKPNASMDASTTSSQTRGPSLNLVTVPASSSLTAAATVTTTTNGFITTSVLSSTNTSQTDGSTAIGSATVGINKRIFNLTRVEHISAECSNDFIRTVIVFNGTFKGIIYSSGYVRDPNCIYINGTGKTKYDFSIRLNQCGTLGRQEIHPPNGPNEVRRRDQVMWNTLSIQYNPMIEQEWDEHFRVSCEYGSDFWKTVSFSPFNVETNTGSPVVFTVDPPQCQMEILRGHGMVGPRQEAVSGPVTVGDPLTLLIHMRSEKAGYDILVKNCIAHNGGHQKMQLIDSNGCVVNERFISPFRGTYNDNDLKHVTLYSYLKAFRFTGSPVLYLECEIHMCQSSCPPQMCYWRRLSKRSTSNGSIPVHFGTHDNGNEMMAFETTDGDISSNIAKTTAIFQQDITNDIKATEVPSKTLRRSGRNSRKLHISSVDQQKEDEAIGDKHGPFDNQAKQQAITSTQNKMNSMQASRISDKVSLFQALEVRQERKPDPGSGSHSFHYSALDASDSLDLPVAGVAIDNDLISGPPTNSLMCYRQTEMLASLITAVSVLLVAISITIGCCWRAVRTQLKVQVDRRKLMGAAKVSIASAKLSSNLAYSQSSPPLSLLNYSNRNGTDSLVKQSRANYHQNHGNKPTILPYRNNVPSTIGLIFNPSVSKHKESLFLPN